MAKALSGLDIRVTELENQDHKKKKNKKPHKKFNNGNNKRAK